MKPILTLLLLTLITLGSCKSKNSVVEEQSKNNDTTKFFSIAQFLQNEINEVKKTPFYIYRLYLKNNKKDSTAINTDQFINLSKTFLKPDINNSDIKKYYTESIFHDQTTNSFTINYSTLNRELDLQNVDILLEEDGQTVKNIFLRKFLNYGDSSAIEQLSWKPGERFQINRIVQLPDNKETSYQTTVVWNEEK